MKRSVTDEAFFTPDAAVQQCLSILQRVVSLDDFDLVVDPSAGAGAFMNCLPASKSLAMDLRPQQVGIVKQDFLSWRPDPYLRNILTVGNPPFGQRGALAVSFLVHACSFSRVVAFLLPLSFRKWTFQDRVPRNFHLVEEMTYDGEFDNDGTVRTVKTVFQVWVRDDTRVRPINQAPTKHPDFAMKHCHLSRTSPSALAAVQSRYPFAIPQVGANFRPRDSHSITKGSYWFIHPHVSNVRGYFEHLDFGFLQGMNTAHTSLSKRDIVAAYIRASGRDVSPERSGSRNETLW